MAPRSQPDESTVPPAGRPDARAAACARLLAGTLAGLWLAGTPVPGAAEVYRWVDDTGATVYSQVPPPATTPATAIKPHAAPPAAAGRDAMERLRGTLEQDFDKRDQQTRDSAEAAKKAAEQAVRQANCEAARKNLETIRNHGGGRLRTPDGKARFLAKDELAEQEALAQKQIQENCK